MLRIHSLISMLPAWLLAPVLVHAQEGKLVGIPGPLDPSNADPEAAQPPMPEVSFFARMSAQGYLYYFINILFSFVGLALFAALVYAAGLWIISLGGENVKKAKKIIAEAVLGIVITMLSYLIVRSVMGNLGSIPPLP